MGRRPCCDKVGLKKGRWTAEEDRRLKNYILANGEGSWRSLPHNAGLLRCGKSCRLRWINYLKSDLKLGNITSEEDELIIKLHASLGNRWSLIASQLPGRTDNEIKNYWNSHLSRQIHTFRRRSFNDDGSVIVDVARLSLPPRRKGGRTKKDSAAAAAARKIVIDEDDMSLDLDGLLSNVEMEWRENDVEINLHEGGTCESSSVVSCNSLRLDSPWNWESFVGGVEWDAAELYAGEDHLSAATATASAGSEALISWLLS